MICAIVLAAGQSRRMGRQKMLLPYGGTTVIAHVVDQLLAGVVDGVCVVVGHEEEGAPQALEGRPVTVVSNPDPDAGMLSSVRCGIRALPESCDAVMVVLGDQPGITSALVDDLANTFAATGKGIVVPACEGKRGHPLLFSHRYCGEVLTSFDDLGLRGLLRAHPDDVVELEVSDDAVLSDMDRPEDYQEALRRREQQAQGHAN